MTDFLDRLATALGDHYQIEGEIGAGGMATVYLARDTKHQRHVALKVLRPELAAALGGERFLREIEIAAQIEHPHVLTLIDSGDADGVLYYVMPYMKGDSLRDRLSKEGKLPISDAVRVLRDVADGLAEAHRHGLVHRDIKPDNVMMSGNHAVVMDFGVAKAVSSATGGHNLTTAGISLGTPSYMSPEQVTADPNIDHRTDIYALGAMGYELLAGRPPFLGSTTQEILAAHVTATPDPVSTHRAETPPALEAVIMKCLEKRPADRWETASDVLRRLEAIATPSGGVQTLRIPALTPGRRSLRRPRNIAIAVLIVMLAVLAVLQRQRANATRTLVEQLQTAVDSDRFDRVHALLVESGRSLGDKPLSTIAAAAGGVLTCETAPTGASIELSRAGPSLDSTTTTAFLGDTPLSHVVLVAGEYLARVAAEDHLPAQFMFRVAVGDTLTIRRRLVPDTWDASDMVIVEAGSVPGPLADQFTGVQVPAFLIDRYEVTNEQFMRFVSDGGYRNSDLWPDSLLVRGAWVPRERALSRMVDRTGLPGPRSWSGGTFLEGRGKHPVTNISWHEARAFAAWAGKSLPTLEQWWRAALGDGGSRFPWGDDVTSIDQRSNFGGVGTTPVGSFLFGASPFGVHDLAGNVREWLAGGGTSGRMVVLGGSWQTPTYMFDTPNLERFDPSFESEEVGFRLVQPIPAPTP